MMKVAKVPEKSKSKFCFMGRVVFLVDFKIFCYIYIYICPQDHLTSQLFYRVWLVFLLHSLHLQNCFTDFGLYSRGTVDIFSLDVYLHTVRKEILSLSC